MSGLLKLQDALNRRTFMRTSAHGFGLAALSSMLPMSGASPLKTAPKAKLVIYLFQSGAPSQMDLFDPKPELTRWHGQPYLECGETVTSAHMRVGVLSV